MGGLGIRRGCSQPDTKVFHPINLTTFDFSSPNIGKTMQQVQDQFAQNFAQRIIDRYELPKNIHVSMKNSETLTIVVAGDLQVNDLLNGHLPGLVQAGIDWGFPFIDVVCLDDRRKPLRLRTDSCRQLLEKIS
jgi:hypothetical protein